MSIFRKIYTILLHVNRAKRGVLKAYRALGVSSGYPPTILLWYSAGNFLIAYSTFSWVLFRSSTVLEESFSFEKGQVKSQSCNHVDISSLSPSYSTAPQARRWPFRTHPDGAESRRSTPCKRCLCLTTAWKSPASRNVGMLIYVAFLWFALWRSVFHVVLSERNFLQPLLPQPLAGGITFYVGKLPASLFFVSTVVCY